jgi:hypothetical protein
MVLLKEQGHMFDFIVVQTDWEGAIKVEGFERCIELERGDDYEIIVGLNFDTTIPALHGKTLK